ncbi:AMP-dependent synthetase [Dactylosporangium vinaceum]|uniref:TIGR03089 family protein n=1 Tax=Dactylosporangium vinaceum TaxID=53362 RepID=A0ABV5MBD8_9ACTN|nr:TIGR03089 family protein [Dactylosporangium vinaceum]UAB98415.1 AMP-dependent synthetase [Dactylosporangium vinaceum]
MGNHRAPEPPEPIQPSLLTFHDAATGEYTALSASELGECAAQVAGLLREGCGLGDGGRAAILLPPHWLTAAVLMGGWSAGLALSLQGRATAGLAVHEPGADAPYDVSFVAADRIGSYLENVPPAKHQFTLFTEEPPPGYRDLETAIDEFSPHLPAFGRTRPGDAATPDGTSYGEWGALAAEVAGQIGLRPGDRLLVDAGEHEHPLKWLLAPMAAGASVVICANATPEVLAALTASEGITHTLR